MGNRLAARTLVCALAVLGALSDAAGQVPPDRVDPRHPAMVELPEIGRMIGTLRKGVASQIGEEYGKTVIPLSDCNNDSLADWGVSRLRIDTVFETAASGGHRLPMEAWLYYGVRGGLPKVEDGIRIGPSELNSETKFLASGYWDDDPYKDLCVAISIIGDTSNGNAAIGYDLWRIVVFWGQPNGIFTLADTTHLQAIDDVWLSAFQGFSGDFDGSGRESLLLRAGGGLIAGQWLLTAKLHIFQHNNVRWGRWGGGVMPHGHGGFHRS